MQGVTGLYRAAVVHIRRLAQHTRSDKTPKINLRLEAVAAICRTAVHARPPAGARSTRVLRDFRTRSIEFPDASGTPETRRRLGGWVGLCLI